MAGVKDPKASPPPPEPELPPASGDYLRAEHHRLERRSDRMRSALLQSVTELEPGVPADFEQLRRMAAAHFEKERKVLYPRLQPAFAELLLQLEDQHTQIGEFARQVGDLLETPAEARGEHWLRDVRAQGTELLDSIQRHFVREEDQLLRPADRDLSAGDQRRLAEEMNAI